MRLSLSPTPSNTPSNTPSITPSQSSCPLPITIISSVSTNGCGLEPLTGSTNYVTYSGTNYLYDDVSIDLGNYQMNACLNVESPYVGQSYQFDLIIDPDFELCNSAGYYYDRIIYRLTSYGDLGGGIYYFGGVEEYYYGGILQDTIAGIFTFINQTIDTCNIELYIYPQFRIQKPSVTPTQTQTQTQTQTPSPTFCYEPQAYLLLDAASGSTALSNWMKSFGFTGTSFQGMNQGFPISTIQSTFEAQMNAYISYTGYGNTTFYIEDEPIISTTQLEHYPEQLWSSTNVWNTWFVPTCPFCDNGSWTTWNGAALNSTLYNKTFYYSGSNIPQGYYKILTTYTASNMRSNTEIAYQLIDTLVCPSSATPTPTLTKTPTSTPSQTQTQTPSMTNTPSQTTTQTQSPTCGTFTTQYMRSQIQGTSDIRFTLFDNPDFTGNANAVCDYTITGTYNIDGGAINQPYTTIMANNDHNHTYNTGSNITGFTITSVVPVCPCVLVIFNQVTPTPSVTPTLTPTLTQTTTMTNTPSMTQTQTPSPTSGITTCAVAEIRTDASLNIPITGVEVNSIPMTYLSGDTFPISPSDPSGYYGTFQTGSTNEVRVYYGSNIAGQNITILDCDAVSQCCDLNPGGGICVFDNVNIICGCTFTITGSDGSCI
jgi:hypothetical protein